jgi:hypothetical protein
MQFTAALKALRRRKAHYGAAEAAPLSNIKERPGLVLAFKHPDNY